MVVVVVVVVDFVAFVDFVILFVCLFVGGHCQVHVICEDEKGDIIPFVTRRNPPGSPYVIARGTW